MLSDKHMGHLDRGAAAVEMALVLLMLMLMLVLFGIIDFGRGFNAQMQVTQAAREAVRVKALGGTDANAQSRADAATGGLAASPPPAPHIKGYAAFYVTGVDIVGGMKKFLPGYPTGAATTTCTAKGGKCIYGWFVENLFPSSAVIGGGSTYFGLKAVQVAG